MTSSKVWLMYKNEKEFIEIVTIAINQNKFNLIFLEESSTETQIEKEKLVKFMRNSRGR